MPAFAIARDFSLHKFQLSEVLTTAGRLDREAKRQLIQTILNLPKILVGRNRGSGHVNRMIRLPNKFRITD
jgi:hypothetical protein